MKNIAMTGWSFIQVRDLFGHLWYIVGYIWILLLSPFLNKIVTDITRRQYRNFIILISFLLVGLSSMNDFVGMRMVYGYTFNSFSEQDSYNIILFIPLYFIGGYISRFNIRTHFPFIKFLITGLLVTILTMIYSQTGGIKIIGRSLMGIESVYIFSFYEAFCKYNNIFIIIMAYYLFMTFRQMKFKSIIINNISKGSYIGYLIHIVMLSLIYFLVCNIMDEEAEYPFYTVKTLPFYFNLIIGVVSAIISIFIGMMVDKIIRKQFSNNV